MGNKLLTMKNSTDKVDKVKKKEKSKFFKSSMFKKTVVEINNSNDNNKTKIAEVRNSTSTEESLAISNINGSLGKTKISKLLTVNDPSKEPKVVIDIKSKRIIKEFDDIFNCSEDNFVRANTLDPNNLSTPLLIEMNIPSETKLLNQASKHNINTIIFAVYLTNQYPFEQPEIRIVRPKIKLGTGFVMNGGAICANILFKNGWSPLATILSSIVSILSLMCDDSHSKSAELDEAQVGKEYTFLEYKSSFKYVTNAHKGWAS
jgi:ubiquitin-protein ligase